MGLRPPDSPTLAFLTSAAAASRCTERIYQDVHIDGFVEADLDVAGRVFVASHAVLKGRLQAHSVAVRGYLAGDVTVRDCATIHEYAVIEGTLRTSRLIIEEGAAGTVELVVGNAVVEAPWHTSAVS